MRFVGQSRVAAMVALALLASMPVALTGRAGVPDFSKLSFRPSFGGTGRKKRTKPRYNTTLHKPNGKQECARRVRQMNKGMLTCSNGLHFASGSSNSHGQFIRSAKS